MPTEWTWELRYFYPAIYAGALIARSAPESHDVHTPA